MDEGYINLRVKITRVADGEVANDVFENWYWNQYWWEEGNGCCNCNRELFFVRARNEPEPEDTGYCTGKGAYRVHLEDADTGEVLYTDAET